MPIKPRPCPSSGRSRTKAERSHRIAGTTAPLHRPLLLCVASPVVSSWTLQDGNYLCVPNVVQDEGSSPHGGVNSQRDDKTPHMSSLQTRDAAHTMHECGQENVGPEGNGQHSKASDRDCHSNSVYFSCTELFLISSSRKTNTTCPAFTFLSIFF